ncbi:MAG: hypothetical protein M1830_007014 [Pleopsidium flavum]|nr:MAG: hypothetical protein M1830_007014 [Pleopsidium flavum]
MATKMTWDGVADQQLLLSILAAHEIKIDFDAVAANLGCTPRAVQERLKKLKKVAGEQNSAGPPGPKTPSKSKGAPTNGDAATPTPTPKKRKVATPKSAKAKGKKDINMDKFNAEEDGEGAEEAGDDDIAEEDVIGRYLVKPDKGAIMTENVMKKRQDPVLYDGETDVLRGDFVV